MRRLVIFALIFAAIGAACVWLSERGARGFERMLIDRVENGLAELGLDWTEVRADGLWLEIHGHAPDPFARDLALESARATASLAEIVDFTTVAVSPPRLDPLRLEMLRDGDGMTLTGRFQGEAMRAGLIADIAAAAPALAVHDLTGVNAAVPGAGWGPELDIAVHAAARVPNAYVRIEPGAVRIEGMAHDEAHRAELTAELLALAGDEIHLTLALRKPLVVAAPFVFAVVKDSSGGIRLERCNARDASEEVAIEAVLSRFSFGAGVVRCPAALGGPSGDWPGAIAAGLGALGGLPAGRFRLDYRSAQIEAAAPSGTADMETAVAALAAGLPEGYALFGSLAADSLPIGAVLADQRARYWMRITAESAAGEAGGVVLSGMTPDAVGRRVIETYAAARFGKAAVQSALSTAPADLQSGVPPGWEAAAIVALDLLGETGSGEAELSAGRLLLRASVDEPGRAGALHRLLEGEVPAGYRVQSELTVDLPAQVAAVALTLPRCVSMLGATVLETPVVFAPGSAVIEEQSSAALERLGAIFARCAEGAIEIAGHTDSQGSEALNQRLSQARAEALLDAMLARGVRLGRLAARGYGEANPVASNQTEGGRAQNRRIEFTAVE